MHQVSANYTMPTILNTLMPAAKSATAKSAATKPTAADSPTSGSTSSSSGTDLSTTFLTLLAQELQNQDPTAPVDPTEMVGQMISLNQLEQLISINQTITGAATGTSATGSSQSSNAAANSDAQAAAAGISSAVLPAANGSISGTSSPWGASAATSQLPFDPNTMMPLNTANSSAASSFNSYMNPTTIGFSGTNNNTSGGK